MYIEYISLGNYPTLRAVQKMGRMHINIVHCEFGCAKS